MPGFEPRLTPPEWRSTRLWSECPRARPDFGPRRHSGLPRQAARTVALDGRSRPAALNRADGRPARTAPRADRRPARTDGAPRRRGPAPRADGAPRGPAPRRRGATTGADGGPPLTPTRATARRRARRATGRRSSIDPRSAALIGAAAAARNPPDARLRVARRAFGKGWRTDLGRRSEEGPFGTTAADPPRLPGWVRLARPRIITPDV